MKKAVVYILAAALLTAALVYVSPRAEAQNTPLAVSSPIPGSDLELAAQAGPALPVILEPVASGLSVHNSGKVSIDYSNAADGYIMIKADLPGEKLKVIVTGPDDNRYTYNLNEKGEYEVFPLTSGNGQYKVGVYKNLSGTKYSLLTSKDIKVTLKDEFAPFVRPNQYVNFKNDSNVVALAARLTADSKTELDQVQAIYHYVVNNFTYDYDKAKTVTSGYLPDVDEIVNLKKGICFDYAAVMTAMLRSLGIPSKLVIGYAGTVYHAWISVYIAESGWVEAVIFFDGSSWKLMDPTFASTAKSSKNIMEYIANTDNYKAKYLY